MDKAKLEKQLVQVRKVIADLKQDITRINRSTTRSTTPTSAGLKQSQIASKERDIIRHQKRAADLELKIANKLDDINRATRSLERELEYDQRRQDSAARRQVAEPRLVSTNLAVREWPGILPGMRATDSLGLRPMGLELDHHEDDVPEADSEPQSSGLRVFYVYARKDGKLLSQLRTHLSQFQRLHLIDDWHDREISAGRNWEGEISTHLEAAHIILLLVSADFLDSDYCFNVEMKRALEREQSGEARVIPIILRPVHWSDSPFRHLQALPKDGKPIIEWRPRDKGWADVATGIRRVITELQGQP